MNYPPHVKDVYSFFIGLRLYILDCITYTATYQFSWMPLLQVWRGGDVLRPFASWVTDDYGTLVQIVKPVTLH